MRVRLSFPLIVLTLCVMGCRARSDARPNVRTQAVTLRVRTVKPTQEDVALSSPLIGTLRPWKQSVLASRVAGDVVALSVERGDRVKRGQSLGSLRVPGLTQELAATVAIAEVEEASLAEQVEIADRTKRVATANAAAVSLQEVAMSSAKAKTAAAKLRAAQVAATHIRSLLSDAQIVAPFDGVVLVRYVDPGTSVAAGMRLVEVADVDTFRLFVDVPERETPLVTLKAPVAVRFPSLGERQLEAVVSRFAPALDPTARTLRVEIDLKNEGTLVAGMEARVRFRERDAKDSLTLPADTLVLQAEGTFVLVVRNGKTARVPIQVGFDNGAKFEVRQGLDAAEEVIVGASSLLEEGTPVEVVR